METPSHSAEKCGPIGLLPLEDPFPGADDGFSEPEQFAVLGIDDAFLGEKAEVDHPTPVGFTHQHHRKGFDLAGLNQRQSFEQFVEGAVTARKGDQGPGAQQKVQLAQGKIVNPETEARGEIRVGKLFMRRVDVESDGFGTDLPGAAVGW